jgi:N-acetyl-gamma-glutamyl-phosphate reductase
MVCVLAAHSLFFHNNITELSKEQRAKLQKSKRISNPGCYPTGFIALTKPLVDAGIVPVGTPLTVNAISGYSGGGKALMNLYETEEHEPWGTYGLNLAHKHVPEMSKVCSLYCVYCMYESKVLSLKTNLYAAS